MDHYRRRAARPEQPAGAAADLDGRVDGLIGEPSGDVPGRELAVCLLPLIDRLPEKYGEALMLTEFDGLTQIEPRSGLGSRCRA